MIALRRVARGENAIGFAKWWPRAMVLSAVLIVVSIGSLATRGLNLGIDFEGGTSWEVNATDASVATTREALEPIGEGAAKIQIVSSPSGGNQVIRVQSGTTDADHQAQVRQTLADLAGVDVSTVSVSTVGPSWGAEITRSALRALIVFLVALLIYLSIRLQWEMAVGAVVSVIHDLLISVGIYSVFQIEVTPATVIAFLTILGFSIYDTVVVFDKVKDNQGKVSVATRMNYTDMVSLSMNQVLLRSINTTIAAILPVISILVVGAGILGAVTLEEFGTALLIGLLLGAYSSIFIAAPVLTSIKERQGRYQAVRERIEASRPTSPIEGDTPAPVGRAAPSAEAGATPAGTTPRPAAPTGTIPRPRKKTKRR